MSTYERAINQGRDEANFELLTDMERLRTAFKLSKKKMSRNGEP